MDPTVSPDIPSSIMSRRQVLAAGSALALSGCLGRNSGGTSNTNVRGAVADASVPSTSSSYTYATMGAGDGPTVTYYGNWKCPYCAEFSTGLLSDIVTDYVETGDINLEFRALVYVGGDPFLGPDAPRAARAGLAVWNVDPETYWKYHEYVFANQPPEGETWATTEKLVSFAEEAGVTGIEQVRGKLDGQTYESALRKTSQAAVDADVSGTPTLVIDGEAVNPLSDEARARTLIEQLIDGA